jgi:CHASE2 domain-containing sensor protein
LRAPGLRRWWARRSERQRAFALNVAIGTVISVLAGYLETNAAVGKARDALLTWQIAQFASTDVARDILWLDVDETTYLNWHAPALTPRDKLCRLIDFAVRGKARVVVVDVDLSEPTAPGDVTPAQPCGKAHAGGDAELKAYLHEYATACNGRDAQSGCPPIVLVRELRTSYRSTYADGAPAHARRPQYFDDAAFGASGPVFWSSPNFDVDDDAMIRRWRLWEPLCDPSDVLPSTELLAGALFAGTSPERVRQSLQAFRPACVPVGGASNAVIAAAEPPESELDVGHPLRLSSRNADRRFFYRVGWESARGRATMAAFVPATLVTDVDAAHAFDPAVAAGRIVVIGGSYLDNPDLHRTPLGLMPGTLILINAIQALVQNDSLRETPAALRIGIEGALILVLSALSVYLPAAAALIVSILFVIASALTFGFVFLNMGYWIDPVLPLLGIFMHNLFEFSVHRWRHRSKHA